MKFLMNNVLFGTKNRNGAMYKLTSKIHYLEFTANVNAVRNKNYDDCHIKCEDHYSVKPIVPLDQENSMSDIFLSNISRSR